MENREGQRVPEVTFRTRREGKWVDRSTADIFAGKKVVVFSLPGAFTPTCSASHLPRYADLAPAFRKLGVDGVACVSVNDGFVMEAWGRDQQIGDVELLPDGNGAFSEGMGMLVDKSDLGFGKRSWRYSMLVDDGVVTKMFIEPDKPGDPFEVSDADTMLGYLDPAATAPPTVSVFTREGCPYCAAAKALLKKHEQGYEEIVVGKDVTPHTLHAVTGQSTVPQVYMDGKRIGGSEDLAAHFSGAGA